MRLKSTRISLVNLASVVWTSKKTYRRRGPLWSENNEGHLRRPLPRHVTASRQHCLDASQHAATRIILSPCVIHLSLTTLSQYILIRIEEDEKAAWWYHQRQGRSFSLVPGWNLPPQVKPILRMDARWLSFWRRKTAIPTNFRLHSTQEGKMFNNLHCR